eukprot:2744753-Karenia_brevis.AAC.1
MSATRLASSIAEHVKQKKRQAEVLGRLYSVALKPEPEWRLDLTSLRQVREYVYQPVSTPSGQHGLPHIISCMCHQFHFHVPISTALLSHAA